ncbi:MAG TPA: aldo/keto reductase [Anaerolineales bacterium]|nr:aldo/keto reductase [Anaerolineales bacterium]
MRYRELPAGDRIPVIGLGTWRMGGGSEPDATQNELVLHAIRTALKLGYTHIDTAEMYGGGHTEELIGEVIRDFDRESLFITSKVWHTNLQYPDVLRACENSLGRLGTDYLDLYMIHWPNSGVPLEETFRALNKLVEDGNVRHLGVSNFDLALLTAARQLSIVPLVTDQVPYSVQNRTYAKNGVLAYCQEQDMLLTAYTPLDKGRVDDLEKLNVIARRAGATPMQVALSWLVSQPNIIAIPKSFNPDHLRQNLEAVDLVLDEDELNILDHLAR